MEGKRHLGGKGTSPGRGVRHLGSTSPRASPIPHMCMYVYMCIGECVYVYVYMLYVHLCIG